MCQFNITFSGTPEDLINKAQQGIAKANGFLTGDSTQGSFSVKTPLGSIKGDYKITVQDIFFSITDKPFLISCKRIEKELTGLMVSNA